ncbi:MAG: hypothetical protein JKY56_09245 [Kofleriaceae bacterium]|nr:hypothetical protein [Kofleriaceae bacterium]
MAVLRTKPRFGAQQLIGLTCIVGLSGCDDAKTQGDPMVDSGPGDTPDAMVGETPVVECVSVDGSRLKREYLAGNSQARQEYDIIDTTYGTPCSYGADSATQFTCYPLGADVGGLRYFQDSGCTSAIVGFGLSSTPRKFNRRFSVSADGCSTIVEYLEIGSSSPVRGGDAIFSMNSSGECNAITAPLRDYYIATPASFMSAEAESVSGSERLSNYFLVGSDGSKMCAPLSILHDSVTQTDCRFLADSTGSSRCLPANLLRKTYRSTTSCDTDVEVAEQSTCMSEAPRYSYTKVAGACGTIEHTIYDAATVPLASVFQGNDVNSCVNASADGVMYFKSETEAPASSFVAPEVENVDVAGERLAKTRLVADKFAVFAGCTIHRTRSPANSAKRQMDSCVVCRPSLSLHRLCLPTLSVWKQFRSRRFQQPAVAMRQSSFGKTSVRDVVVFWLPSWFRPGLYTPG